MVWRLDRLGRSLRDLVDLVVQLRRREVALVAAELVHGLAEPVGDLSPFDEGSLLLIGAGGDGDRRKGGDDRQQGADRSSR